MQEQATATAAATSTVYDTLGPRPAYPLVATPPPKADVVTAPAIGATASGYFLLDSLYHYSLAVDAVLALVAGLVCAFMLAAWLRLGALQDILSHMGAAVAESARASTNAGALAERVAQSALGNAILPALAAGQLRIYLAYRVLPAETLAETLRSLDDLYACLFGIEQWRLRGEAPGEVPASACAFGREMLKSHPDARLVLAFAQTGHSIHADFKGAWKTTVDIAIVFHMLTYPIDHYKDVADMFAHVPVVAQQAVQSVPGHAELDALRTRLEAAPAPFRKELAECCSKLRAATIGNQEITGVRVHAGPRE